MAAEQAGVGADGFHEAVLGTLDSVFHLRLARPPLVTGFDLEGNGTGPGKEHHAEAVDQLQGHIIQILACIRHAVVHPTPEGIVIEQGDTVALQVLRQGLEHIFRGISPGGQAVDGVGIQGKAAAGKLPDHEIPGIAEQSANLGIREELSHGITFLPGNFLPEQYIQISFSYTERIAIFNRKWYIVIL